MKLRYRIGLVLAVLGVTFGLGRCKRNAISGPELATPAVLPSNDKEQILVDPIRHTLIIVKPTGNTTLTLPDHSSTIDIRKDGTVQVMSPQFGWEHRPFVGVHGSDYFRIAAGMDAYYFKKLDLGFGAAGRIGNFTPIAFVQLSYSFYDNCRIGVAYGTNRYIGGTLTVRL